MPKLTSTNKYLWNYERVTYTDSSYKDTEARVIGVYGDKGATGAAGKDGKGIKSITEYYLATSAGSGVTTGTSGWTTSVQTITATKKYLWNYEVTAYTDGSSTKSSPVIIGVYGEKGDQGDKGDTGAGYSPNMILHTKDMDGWNWGGSSWNIKQEIVKEADGGSYMKQTVTVTPASADPADNIQSYVWVRNGDTAEYKHMEKYPYELFTPGRKYTLSFEYKSDVPVRVQISVRGTGLGNKVPVELTVFPASAEWTRVSASGTCPGGINNEGYKNCLLTACIGSSQAGSDVAVGDTAYFRNFCLVEGEGTQWVPAASEMVGVPGSSGIDAKRNLLLNSGAEVAAAAGTYEISRYHVSPTEGVQSAGHVGSLVEGEKYTVVLCFTPNSITTQPFRLYSNGDNLWVNFGVPKSGKNIYKATFTCSYNTGTGPNGTPDMAVRLFYGNSGVASSYLGGTVHWIKIVKGETATDEWTPAPEDSDVSDVQVSPAALSFKTDEDDGSVIYTGNTAVVTARHGAQAAKVSLISGSQVLTGLTGFGTTGSGTEAMKVTLTAVETSAETLTLPDGTTKKLVLPVTGGSATFRVKLGYAGYTEERTLTLPFTVDVKTAFAEIVKTNNSVTQTVAEVQAENGKLATSVSQLKQTADSITQTVAANKADADKKISQIQQTADSITQTVKSIPNGGPNLLPHSMWRAVVRSEAGNTWVKLKKGVKYTLSARACAEAGKDLFVSAYAVQSSGQWGRSNAIRFTEADFAEKSLTFVLEDKDGFTYNDEVRVLVYAVNIVKGAARPTEGKGAVVWVQLEEGPAASAWQAQAGDYEERPSLLKAGDRDLTTTATETETVLEDGTTGTVLYHKMTALEVAVGFADVVRFKANTLTFAEPDTQYTISVWAKGTGRIKMYMTANTLGSITQDGAKRIDTDGETEYMELGSTWKRYEATITTDKTVAKNGRVYPLRLFDSGSEVWCYGWKVEKGGMATGGGGASVKYEKELHEYKSDIQQLSDEINLTVKKDDIETAGIHLDGENSTITLRGDRTIIDGDEFNANNATFRNLTVAGNLRTSVVQQPYANDNIFVGKDGDGSLGWMFVHDSGQPSSAKSYVFMPPDPDFIGSRVILHACSAQDSSGTHIATHGMYVLGGRTFCKHAYLEANAGTYYLSRVNAGTGGIRSVAQSVLTGADYFSGKRASVSGGGYYVPNALNNLVGATVELIGAPAFSASAILCPYVVRLGADMLYNREAPPYVLVDEPLVTDPLHAKLKAIYDKDGATAITDLGVGYGVITGATMKYHYSSADSGLMRTKTGLVLFKVPLCQWFISIYNAVSGTFSRASVGTTWENEEWN